MKLPAFETAPGSAWRPLLAGAALGALVSLSTLTLAAEDTPAPAPSASPEATVKPAKAGKGTPKPPKPNAPVSKEIPIVLPIGEDAKVVKIPQIGAFGQVLSQLMAAKMTRIDADHLQMQGTTLDLNKADGKSDYPIEIPTSIFDTPTHIVSSDDPVVIRTEDFELTGERMKFNTVERSGELLGKVKMRIHNLKSTAGFAPQQTPKPE